MLRQSSPDSIAGLDPVCARASWGARRTAEHHGVTRRTERGTMKPTIDRLIWRMFRPPKRDRPRCGARCRSKAGACASLRCVAGQTGRWPSGAGCTAGQGPDQRHPREKGRARVVTPTFEAIRTYRSSDEGKWGSSVPACRADACPGQGQVIEITSFHGRRTHWIVPTRCSSARLLRRA